MHDIEEHANRVGAEVTEATVAQHPARAAALLPMMALAWALGSLVGAGWHRIALLYPSIAGGALALGILTRWKLLCCALSTAAVAAFSVAHELNAQPPPCHVSRHVDREVVHLWASVSGRPERTATGLRQRIRARALKRRGGLRVPLCGQVELRRPQGSVGLHPGEQVLLRARLRRATSARNPGLPSAMLRHRSEDIGAVAFVEHLLVIGPRSPSAIASLRAGLRRVISRALPRERGRAIVLALVLGDRDELSAEQRERFSRAGLSHLLAVSGLHLSLVAMGVFAALRAALRRSSRLAARRDPRCIAAVGAAGMAIAFTLLTGAAPATVRACVMSCALFFAVGTGRAGDRVRPLALAGLGLTAADPLLLFRPGFQLSFAAVLGIMLALRRRERRARRRSLAGRILETGAGVLLTTSAATLLTAPLVAHHFGILSLAAVPANLFAVPLTGMLLLPLSLLGTLLAAIAPTIGVWPLRGAGWLAEVLDGFSASVGGSPLSALTVQFSWPLALALICAAVALLLPPGRGRRCVALGAALALAVIFAARWLAADRLELVFLDVGQGDATFLRFPDGSAMLVDAGGTFASRGDPGRRRVVPFLRRQGVSRLEIVVATHPHADHVKGLEAVLGSVDVGEVWCCWHNLPSSLHGSLLRWAHRRGIAVRAPRVWRRGQVTVRPLWPRGSEGLCAYPARSNNDNSIVLRVDHGRSSVLLTGDIEAEVEAELLDSASPLSATVLKVAHHGSESSSTEALLRAVSPRLAVISCGAENAFGVPHDVVLRRLDALRIPVARTDELGAVIVALYADGSHSWQPGKGLLP